jgi:hypothetical protein
MKTRSIIAAALAIVASGAALAGEAEYQYPQQVTSSVTRAEVHAQMLQARAAGTIVVGEASGVVQSVFASTRNRADVHAEAIAAGRSGEIAALSSEAGVYAPKQPKVEVIRVAGR